MRASGDRAQARAVLQACVAALEHLVEFLLAALMKPIAPANRAEFLGHALGLGLVLAPSEAADSIGDPLRRARARDAHRGRSGRNHRIDSSPARHRAKHAERGPDECASCRRRKPAGPDCGSERSESREDWGEGKWRFGSPG